MTFSRFLRGLWKNRFLPIPAERPVRRRLQSERLEGRVLPAGHAFEPYGANPMRFEANVGQTDSQVRFLSRGDGYSLFLTSNEAVLSLAPVHSASEVGTGSVLRFQLVGGAIAPEVNGVSQLSGSTNYLRGNDPAAWHVGAPSYAAVAYRNVYPGIDVVYHGSGRQLEYDFTVSPSADPRSIRLNIVGTTAITVDASGDLRLHTAAGDLIEHSPVLYQGDGVNRQTVSGGYVLNGDGTVGFAIGSYDAARPLVIDPVLAYSTYLGSGIASDLTRGATGNAVAVDKDGNAYLTGKVYTSAFPKCDGVVVLQRDFAAFGNDAYVTKLDSTGQIVFSTYLGGNPDESSLHITTDDKGFTYPQGEQDASSSGDAIAVDAAGNIYVTGMTISYDRGDYFKIIGFVPIVNAFQTVYGGAGDAFVAKLNPNGSALIYSSYYGGATIDYGTGIAADADGNAYMIGSSISGAYTDVAFVVKINAVGGLVYKTSFGGERTYTYGNAIAADARGNVYFTGETTDTELATPPLAGTSGGHDVIVGRLDPDGVLLGLVRLGGDRNDFGSGIALDADNDAYLTGTTFSLNFPTTENAFQKDKPRLSFGVPNAFVTKLNPDLSKILYSTYLGGTIGVSVVLGTSGPSESPSGESGYAIAVDSTGAAYVAGRTASADFPSVNPAQQAHAPVPDHVDSDAPYGQNDAFVARLDPDGTNLTFSTYFGGSGQDAAFGIGLDVLGNAYVVGTTDSPNLHTTPGALQASYAPHQPAFTFDPSGFGFQTSAFVLRLAQPLQVIAQPVQAFIGKAFTDPVATFTAPDPSAVSSDFTASVNYGDGFIDPTAAIQRIGGPGTPFRVLGNHAYMKLGAFPIVVTVTDNKHHEIATTDYNVSPYRGNQAEPAIAVDPRNPLRLFAMTNDQPSINRTAAAGGGIYAAFSTDGGITWLPSDYRDHTIADGNDGLTLALGDPNALFDSFGNLFIAYMRADSKGVVIALSIDGGKSFTPLGDPFTDASGVDQPKLAIGPGDLPGTESLWVTFEKEVPRTILVAGFRILGLGAVDTVGGALAVPGSADGLLSAVTVGPKGQVLVSWENTSSDPLLGDRIRTNANPDGLSNPTNFASQPVVATQEIFAGTMNPIPAQNRRGVDANPRVVWDTSKGPHAGRVYMSFVTPGPMGTNVKLLASDDDGAHWTAFGVNPNGSPHSIQVNDSTAMDYAFMPSIAIDATNGDLALSWYDTRSDQAASKLTQFFTAISSDGGQTFSANVPVSLGASDATIAATENQYYDYSAVAFRGGWLYPAWADNSFGKSPVTPLDVLSGRIAAAHVSAVPPEVTGMPLNLVEGQLFDGTVATFNDPDLSLGATDFTATIDWGDGTAPSTDTNTITAAEDGTYAIRASHRYATPGVYVLGVTVHDEVHDLDGSTVTNVSRSPGYQGETTSAIDPKDPTHLFVASNSDGPGLFAASSTDGGLTWTRTSLATGIDGLPTADGDPKAVYDQFGNLFLTYLTDGSPHSVVVAVSADNGLTFTTVDILNDPDSVDQPSIAIGPDISGLEGSVWVTYQTGNNDIMAAHAAVGGLGLVGIFTAVRVASSPGSAASRNFGDIAIGPSGQALVSYESPSSGPGPAGIFVNLDRGKDHPESFGPPVLVTTTNVGGFATVPPQTERLVDAEANLAWDLGDSPHRGRVYLVYTDAAVVNDPDTNIFLRYSDDDGKTWSDPIQVNDDTSGNSQFLPSVAVDPSNGDVAVAWYDARNDDGGVKAEFFVAISNNGGRTFSQNAAVSLGASDASDPALNSAGHGNQFGDYTGVAILGGFVYPAWTDNSPELGANPDRPQFEVAVARAATAHVTDIPLIAVAKDISDALGDEGESFTADVATFTDADPNANLALYSATIDWGDDTDRQPGTLRNEDGTFVVSGEHAYRDEGSYTITVTIDDKGGASTKVTIDADIEDASLTAVGPIFRPAVGLSFTGVVATFTDGNPNAKPHGVFGDYDIPTIKWGDGASTSGTIVFDGSAALTSWSFHNDLLAIGNSAAGDRSLMALSTTTATAPALMPLGPEYFGGLAEGPNFDIYALSNNGAGESFLNILNPDAQTTRAVAYLGSGFTGGLAFDQGDGQFYAIVNADAPRLYAIDAKTGATRSVGPLESHTYSGLAYAGAQTFYAVGADADGRSKLYRIHLGTDLELTALDVNLGSGFTGGLAETLHYVGEPNPFGLLGGLVGLSSRGDGSAFLNRITPDAVTPAYEIPGFNNGFAIVGTHTYSVKGAQTVSVEIRDIGGSAAIASSTAEVGDEPPIALGAPPAITVFQGFASGPLTLGSFLVPHGADIGPNAYTASIDWGDGAEPDAGLVTVSGTTITISSAGHTYTQLGATTGEYHPRITLTDRTENAAYVVDSIHVAPDVSDRVRVVGLGGPLNPATGIFTSTGSITNLSGVMIPGPLYLIVRGLPAGVTLANAGGTLFSGEPFYVANVSQLNAGQTFPNLTLQFSDPGLLPFTYSVATIDGPVGSAVPAGTVAAPGAAGPGFIVNEGQSDAQVRFLSQGDGYTLFLTSTGAVLSLFQSGSSSDQPPPAVALGLQFVGANSASEAVGLDPLASSTNYLLGNDPSRWHASVRSFGRVQYRDIYPGIALEYYSTTAQRLEYDFAVAAGADPGLIRLAFQGADSIALDSAGNLVLHTAAGDVVEQAPVMYQQVGGVRRAVAGAYEIGADGRVGFRIGAYDHSAPLVIDPVLAYSTYFGGSKLDVGKGIATDAAGNTYITGSTHSPDFPTLGALGTPPDRLGQAGFSGGTVAFVTKLDPTGAVVYSTYLGGSGLLVGIFGPQGEVGNGIAVNSTGEAYVTGSTYSRDFPTERALASSPDEPRTVRSFLDTAGAFSNGFVAKLSADGSHLLFSTYLTGTQQGSSIALDPDGNAYITGVAATNFPAIAGAVQTRQAVGFVEKLSATGDRVLYATFVPGTEIVTDPADPRSEIVSGTVKGIAVNAAGEAYLVGDAFRQGGPVLNAAQPVYGGGFGDAFVAKLDSAGTSLVYWTYLGGSDTDSGNAIAVDAAGNAYIAGTTMSADLPTRQAVQPVFGGTTDGRIARDGFVTELSAAGSLVYSTYLGGRGPDAGTGIAVDVAGNAYVTGQTGSADFPVRQALQPIFRGDGKPETVAGDSFYYTGRGDGFVTRISAGGTTLDYSTYLGGGGFDGGNAIAVGPAGDAVVIGFTSSFDFPTLNAVQPQASFPTNVPYDVSNIFVTRIASQGPGVLHLSNVPFAPVEGVPFTGIVASFTDTDTSVASDYTVTIDWGDGTTSVGVVTSSNANGFGFVVSGTHTYSEVGAYPVTVSIRDADGSTATATETSFGQSSGGPVSYRITIDTSVLAGTSGSLDFQFNPGAVALAQPARATILNLQAIGGNAILLNGDILNELKQGFTFGNSLSFEVRLDGEALSAPGRGLFGSTFALLLLGADGAPLQTAAADGSVLRIALDPDGGSRVVAADSRVTASAVNSIAVADAPLTAELVPIQAVEGTPFAGTVASFVDANPAAVASDFTASILWGYDSGASPGTIVADGNAHFHVVGEHTYRTAGYFAIRVAVRDRSGSAALASGAASKTTQIAGLQAPRVVYAGTGFSGLPVSFANGDFNGDGKVDMALWHSTNSGPSTLMLDVLLGNGDGSFQDPRTVVTLSPNSSVVPIALADFNGDGKLDIASNDFVFLGNGDGTFQSGKPFDGFAPNVALSVADFNGDGKPDLAVVNGFGSNGGNPGVRILLGNGDGTFGQHTTYFDAVGSTGTTIVTGDFNNDGKPDIVFSPQGGGTTVLFTNRGGGTFGTTLPVANGFTADAAADLNGDGNLDLVGVGNGRVLVALGNGDGSFRSPIGYTAGEQPTRVVLGDFDGDGGLDLAVDSGGGVVIGAGVSLLKGNRDGTFAAAITFPTNGTPSGSGGTTNLSSGDFNGDGSLDVAVQTLTTISILFGQGDGTLVDDLFSPTGQQALYVAAADFDGDGRVDVAVSDSASLGPTVLAGNGNGTFQTAAAYQTDSVGSVILSGDFNGDGHPDIISGHQLLIGRGDGTYLPAVGLDFAGAQALAQADFNLDGKLDLVTHEFHYSGFTPVDTLRILLGNGDGTFRVAGFFTGDERVASLAVADMNGDGIPDLVFGRDFSVAVLLGRADGTLQPPLVYTIPNQSSFGVVLGDFNGDGKPDVAAFSNGVNILLGNGDGSLRSSMNYDSGFSGTGFGYASGDFNGDGKLDLIRSVNLSSSLDVRILLGNGDGSFGGGVTISTAPVDSFPVVTGDFNGDGRLDFAVGGRGAMLVVLGNGDGTFQPGLAYASANFGNSYVYSALTTDDVNGDGRIDLIAEDVAATINVFLAQPGGVLLGARSYLERSRSVQAIDLNGDGRPDLVGIETSDGSVGFFQSAEKVYVLLNRGDGTFPQFADYDVRRPEEQDQRAVILGVIAGDFNGDGTTDLVADVAEPFAGFRRAVLLGNGDGTFRAPRITDVSFFYSMEKLLARDVNGDGKLDLVALAEDSSDNYLQVNLGNGDGTFQVPIRTGPLANVDLRNQLAAQGFILADFNGDGKLDAAVGNTDHSISVLPGHGDGTFGMPILSAARLWSTAFAAGDLNGDGKIDLVTANVDSTVSLLIGNGDGTLQKPLTYLADVQGTIGGGYGATLRNDPLTLADLNGDRVLDVIVGAQIRIAALLNRPPIARANNVADAHLTASGADHPATKGVSLFGIIARFTDANPFGTSDDFKAIVTWGDGQTAIGTIQPDLNGGFVVLAANTYAQIGTYAVSVAIADEDGSSATARSAIIVGNGPDTAIAAVGKTIGAIARVPFTGVVATFTASGGSADDYTATIMWGDGHTSRGFVRADAVVGFEVVGSNTYDVAGSDMTSVGIVHSGGTAATIAGNAIVAANMDPPLTPTPVTITATEQVAFSDIVATFTDADPEGKLADFTAAIDWGDGFISVGTVAADLVIAGQFDILGTHSYGNAGNYPVLVKIGDREGAAASVYSTALVEDARVTGLGSRVTVTEGTPYTGAIASFTDSNPFSTAAEFTATIDWGDGRTSSGSVTADATVPGRFLVSGTNSFASAGAFAITVAIAERGRAAATAQSAADVSEAPLAAAGVAIATDPGVAFTTIVAAFSDADPGSASDQFTATIQWGDGLISQGTVAANPAGGFMVSGTHVYSIAGRYRTRISILDNGGALVLASATAEVARSPILASGEPIQTTEGTSFSGTIASFAIGGTHRMSDFAAAIDWGDGHTSSGIVVVDLSSGRYRVLGTNTYSQAGAYAVAITLADRTGILATVSSTAEVADAPLTANAIAVKAIQNETFTGVVATFTDANPAAASGDFTAYVYWNGQFSFGTVVANPNVAGQFDVIGSFVLTDLGTFPVTAYVVDRAGASAIANATVVVSTPPTAAGASFLASAGVSLLTTVATISDSNPGDRPSDFTAIIDWGDGYQTRGLVTGDQSNPGQFLVLGSTTYFRAGSYPVAVELVRVNGDRLTASSTVAVVPAPDAPLTARPVILNGGRQNISLNTIVATFQDADITSTNADFVAMINWGDGATSLGIVQADASTRGQFVVLGNHIYTNDGTFLVRIGIVDVGGASTATSEFVPIAPTLSPPPPPPPVAPPGHGQIYAVGAGPGGGPRVQVYDAVTNAKRFDIFAFDSGLRGGVSVATGDVTGDGIEDLIVGAGVGGGAHVKVFDGVTGALLASWFAYDSDFRGGVWVAAGDLDGDGTDEVVTGPGIGGGPLVEIWKVTGGHAVRTASFLAFDETLRGGVTVAIGAGTGGREVIAVGTGPGGPSQVRTFDGVTREMLMELAPFGPQFTGGVYLAVGDVIATGFGAQLLIGPGLGGGPRLRILDLDGTVRADTFAAVDTLRNGLTVAALERPARLAAVLVGAGVGAYRSDLVDGSLGGVERVGFFDGFDGGVFVG